MQECLVAPISGPAFPAQMGLIAELGACSYRPNLCLGTSGGSAALYACLAADWQPNTINYIGSLLHSRLFLRSWWHDTFLPFMPSWTIGYFRGSLYQKGIGVQGLFEQLFVPETIVNCEIWSGTVNKHTRKAQFFCNLSEESSSIKDTDFNLDRLNIMSPIYLQGEISDIALAAQASASIPTIVPPQELHGGEYADGGVLYASPLSVLKESLNEKSESIHITYISGFDLGDLRVDLSPFCSTYVEEGYQAFEEIISSLRVQDRMQALELLRQRRYEYGSCDQHTLRSLLQRRKEVRRSVLELYPSQGVRLVDITNFNGQDVERCIQATRHNYHYRLWLEG